MTLVTIKYITLNLKIFCVLSIFLPKSAKFQNKDKNDLRLGAQAPPRGTMFLFKIWILVSSISYLSMIKKLNGFLTGKASIFQINLKFQKS